MDRNLKRRRYRSSTSSQEDEDYVCAQKRGRQEIDSETEHGPSLANLYAAQEDFLVQEIYRSNVADEEVVVTSECDCWSCQDESELTEAASPRSNYCNSNRSSETETRLEASEEFLDPSSSPCREIMTHSEILSSPVAESMIDSELDHDVERNDSDVDDLEDDSEYTLKRMPKMVHKTSECTLKRTPKMVHKTRTFMGQLTPGSSIDPGSSHKSYGASDLLPYASPFRCPIPQLSSTALDHLWKLMCKKDKSSLDERNPDLYVHQPQLRPRMRVILVDWLSEVTSVFMLRKETFYLAIDYLDRYLSSVANVPKLQLQLIGITCLFVAAKVEEIYPPKIREFAGITDAACSENEIFNMEVDVCTHLNWLLAPITIHYWLEMMLQFICQKQDENNVVTPQFFRSLSTYQKLFHLLDLAILDSISLRFSYCVLAATAIYILVDPNLAISISGLEEEVLEPCVQWMSVYWRVLRRLKNYETDNKNELLTTKNEVCVSEKIPELHEHIVSVALYEHVQDEFELIESLETDSSKILTPPPSTSKSSA